MDVIVPQGSRETVEIQSSRFTDLIGARRRELGECAWTMHVDNTFGQPGVKT